ncbi:MAG TPA: LLM class F420-dependent oxidoreductase [Ktedonobacteraceae bacterium]|nr:LLM class F420-dependent oxidoreductase [Ktedonobacteraceae bacterium]
MALKFGLIVPQGWRTDLAGIADPIEAYETMTLVAQEAEGLGYDSVWLFDHFHTVPEPRQEMTFECWTSTAALARDTKRVRIGQLVTCNGYRNPALLAKMASTVDVLSHGRLDFGIGAGWYEHEYQAYGYGFPDIPTRLRSLRDAIQVILAMWTQEEAVFEGNYSQIHRAINQPKGVQRPHIPLLIGGGGEQVTLKLVAQYADACNLSYVDVTELAHKLSVLKKHCEEIGRDYESIRRTVLLMCAIAETEEGAFAATQSLPFRRKIPPEKVPEQALVGTPDVIRRRIAAYEQAGAQEIILYLPDAKNLTSVRLFAETCLSG